MSRKRGVVVAFSTLCLFKMDTVHALLISFAFLVVAPVPRTHADAPPPLTEKAKPIFDGKSLEGWEALEPVLWTVKDGCLTGGDGEKKIPYNDFLTTKASYSNFVLHLKIKLTGDPKTGFINSGVQIRTQRNPQGHEVCGYQCDYGEPGWYAGIYDEGRRNKFIAPADMKVVHPAVRLWDWNDYVIKADGPRIQTWINGVQGVDFTEPEKEIAGDGIIGIQIHGGGNSVVQVKEVFIEELPPTKGAPTWDSLGGVEGQRAKLKLQAPAAKPRAAQESGGLLKSDVVSIRPLGADGKPLNLGFENGTLDDWKVEGDAWTGQPVKGDTVSKRKPSERSNHAGEYWVGGYEKIGDKGRGKLTSVSFEVTHPWASFLVGAGRKSELTRVEIISDADGKVIKSASGHDIENMHREVLDLRPFAGKRIFIRIVDEGVGGWGHVNFDDFVFHEKEPELTPAPARSASAAQGAAANADRAARQKESPVLKHLAANPARPTAVANEDAQRVISTMMLTPGFQAELIAAEPDVKQPVAFAIDERGRLWVAEAYSYPNKQPDGQGKDRIVIFEDVDGDGTFKKRTVFYEGLNLVSGMEVGFGGVWVGAAPELIFIPKDATDKAGKPQVLLDGWGFQDTHETLNSFCWGPDGWLYGNQGVFTRSLVGKPGTPDEQRIDLRSAVWRYHPVRHEFEIFAHGGSNQWGLDFNSNGHLFMTHCRSFWGGGGTTNVIRNGHFWNQANANYAPFISNSGPDFAPELKNFLPAAARYDSGAGGAGKPGSDAIYGGHSHVGTMIYLGDNWPDAYRDHLFTNNLFGHQMNHQVLNREGSGYEAVSAGRDLLLAPDSRYMAVDLQTGPDGAVYLIDWCDLQHCHNPTPEKWDRSNGRIYRVSWKETYKPVKVDLGRKSDVELAQLQTHRSDWFARNARQLLQERAAKGVLDAKAIALLKEQTAGSVVPHVLRAMWTLHVIGALDSAQLEKLAKHQSDIARGWAVQLATERAGKPQLSADTLLSLAKSDSSASVRLAVASALPMLDAAQNWNLSAALAAHSEDKGDRFLPKMIWCGLGAVAAQDFPRALALADTTPLPSLADSIRWYAGKSSEGRDALMKSLKTKRDLKMLAFSLKDEAAVQKPKGWQETCDRIFYEEGRSALSEMVSLTAIFGNKETLRQVREKLANESESLDERRWAFDLLKRVGDPEAVPIFAKLLDHDAFRTAVIPLLSRSSDPATADALIMRFEKLDATERSAALGTLTGRAQLALPLLNALKMGRFDRKHLSALHVRQMRNLHNADVDRLLDEAWGRVNESSEAAKATIARLKKA